MCLNQPKKKFKSYIPLQTKQNQNTVIKEGFSKNTHVLSKFELR